MPNTNISYILTAQSSLAQVLKADADAMKNLSATSAVSFKELTSGMNASTRAAAELRKELTQSTGTTKSSAGGFDSLWASVTKGNLAATAITTVVKGLGDLAGAVVQVGKTALDMAGDWEQSRISFTTFLGSAPAMKSFMSDLQTFANASPFTYKDLETNAKFLLAMGTAGADVLPVLKDVSAAVAAGGGGADALGNVSAAYAKINAEGKTSAIYLNEITRNGVPAFDMLAEHMHVSVAEVRQLASEGRITAQVFDSAFNAYTVAHYGDMLKQQSQTFKGLQSTIEDVGGAFYRAIGAPVIAAIEPELQKLTDQLTSPEVTATLAEWGTNLGKAAQAATVLWDNVAAGARAAFSVVKPVFDALGQLLGSLPDAPSLPDPVAPAAKSTVDLNAALDETVSKAGDFSTEIQAAQDGLTAMKRAQQDASYALDSQIQGERQKLSVLEQQFAVQDRATSIGRLQQKIAKDTALAKDLYSSAGQSAAKRLVDEKQQLEDMQVAQGRDGQKRQLQDKITGLEGQKRAQDHAAQQAQQAVQDQISGYQRAEKAFKADSEQRAKLTAQAQAQEKAREAQRAADTKAADSREDHSFNKASANSTALAKQIPLDQTVIGKALAEFQRQLDEIATALGFPNAAAALKDLRYQFAITGAWIETHMDAAGARLTHIIEGAQVLALKARQAAGQPLLPSGTALIAKWEGEQATLDKGESLADSQYAQKKARIDSQFSKGASAIEDPMPANDRGRKATPANPVPTTDPVNGATLKKMLGIMQGGPNNPAVVPLPGKRASGGPVSAGTAYTVGERGAETFVPNSNGTILPHGGGAVRVVVEHLCPACLQTTVERTIRRSGSALVAKHIMGALG